MALGRKPYLRNKMGVSWGAILAPTKSQKNSGSRETPIKYGGISLYKHA